MTVYGEISAVPEGKSVCWLHLDSWTYSKLIDFSMIFWGFFLQSVILSNNRIICNQGPTVLENPGKSLNLLKKNPGLESPWKFFSVGWK